MLGEANGAHVSPEPWRCFQRPRVKAPALTSLGDGS